MNNILLRKSVRIVLATLSTIFVIILIWIMLDCFPRDVIVEKKAFTYENFMNPPESKKDDANVQYYSGSHSGGGGYSGKW